MKKTITDSDTYRIKIPFYILQNGSEELREFAIDNLAKLMKKEQKYKLKDMWFDLLNKFIYVKLN